jgi:hypothetical protein
LPAHHREILGAGRSLGDRNIPGCLDELGELVVGHFGPVHPETIDRNAVDGPRVASGLHTHEVAAVGRIDGSHGEFAAGIQTVRSGAVAGGPDGRSTVGWKPT